MPDSRTLHRVEYLLVDDDDLFRNRLVRALLDRGFPTSIGVASAEDVPPLVARASINHAIIDLKLGGGDGIQVLKHMRAHCPDTKIVMLTGYGSIVTATAAIKLGALNFLTKPVGLGQILAAFDTEAVISSLPIPSLEQVEWEHIHRVVADCKGNITQAAKALGLHRRSLQRKLQKSPGHIS